MCAMKLSVIAILGCGVVLAGLTGCASQVDDEDRRFFYDSWKMSPGDSGRSAERSHQEIFNQKP
jgi:hypothetical protein